MERLLQDIRFGIRILTKRPGFTLVAVLTLTLGIGATSTAFSIINAVLLRPLPYNQPEELVKIWGSKATAGKTHVVLSYPDFIDLKQRGQSFQSQAAYMQAGAILTEGDEASLVVGAAVSADLFPLLRAVPMLGRTFSEADDQPGSPRVAVLSHRLWQRRFGSDPSVIGKEIVLTGKSTTVLGVMPATFRFPVEADRTEYWVPLSPVLEAMGNGRLTKRDVRFLKVVARLKPGVTALRAQAEIQTISRELEQQYQDTNAGVSFSVIPMNEDLVGHFKAPLVLLFGAVVLVLLIACANVANLLLTHATARQKETGIRVALGATTARIVRQLLTESLIIAIVGGALGLLLALWGNRLLISLSPIDIPRLKETHIDGLVLVFTMAVSTLTGMIFGLAPAVQTYKTDFAELLKDGSRAAADGFRGNRMRSVLVVTEIALALMLLMSAGLLTRSFLHLQHVNPGFNPHGVLTTNLSPAKVDYPDEEHQKSFFRQVIERIQSLPEVQSVGLIDPVPFSGDSRETTFTIEGHPPVSPGDEPTANNCTISPGYFQLMGIPVLKGREFTERDTKDAPQAIVINESFARTFFRNENPLGQLILVGDLTGTPREVVGVVGDVMHQATETHVQPEFYISYLQRPQRSMDLVVRSSSVNPGMMAAILRDAIKQIGRKQYIPDIQTMDSLLADSIAQQHSDMALLGICSAVAMILATVGIYAVLSYSVRQRTHEIGIRITMGARPRDILRLIIRDGMTLALIGILIGLAASVATGRLLSTLLYGVGATDPLTIVVISLLLILVSLLACYVPARRATKMSPLAALR